MKVLRVVGILVVVVGLAGQLANGWLAPQFRYWGTPQAVGNGQARTYLEVDPTTGDPTKLGLRVDVANFMWPEKKMGEFYFEIPQRVRTSSLPFVEVDYAWEAKGHPPKMYEVPHVDVHFYVIPKGGSMSHLTPGDDCMEMSIEGWCRSVQPIPAACCPLGMLQIGASVPFMGSHLIDPTYTDFTKQFIYGAFDGYVHFFELKASLDFLMGLKNGTRSSSCEPIPSMPTEFKIAGSYPTSWCVLYDVPSSTFRFEFQNFVVFPGGCNGKADSCKLIPPKPALPKKCNCKQYPPYPKFKAVPPPSGTGISTTGDSQFSSSGKSMNMPSMTTGGGSMDMSSGSSQSSGMKMGGSKSGMDMGSKSGMKMGGSKSGMKMGSKSSGDDMGGMGGMAMGDGSDFLTFVSQEQVHKLYMVSLAIIGFFFLTVAVSFSLYGTTVSISLCRAEKNNRQLGLIVKMVLITLLLTAIFAARCALIIWEDITMHHTVNSEYLWTSYFLPEIIPALLILLLDLVQIFSENKKAILSGVSTLGFSKSKASSTVSAHAPTSKFQTRSASARDSTSATATATRD